MTAPASRAASRRHHRARFLIGAAACLCLLMGILSVAGLLPWAQADTAAFHGNVSDALSGLPIQGVRVAVGGATALTDVHGFYRLSVPPGTHDVSFQFAGYLSMTVTRQIADLNTVQAVDAVMLPDLPSPEDQAVLESQLLAGAGSGAPDPDWLEAHPGELIASQVTDLPSTIRVLMPGGAVVVMPLDEYVKGVVPNEMSPYYPMEALKAQAVAARCYAATAGRHLDIGADVCTTVHCQVWSPIHYQVTDRAVDETHNVVTRYGNDIIRAYYSAHCDGHTRNSEDVWTGYVPYCRGVACPCGYTTMLGHGVGMCQAGARVLAHSGSTFRDILSHYYTGTRTDLAVPHSLSQPRVSPAQGDTTTIFSYEVLYTSRDTATIAQVFIDGASHPMSPITLTASGGIWYRFQTLLPVGSHGYSFHFENGYDVPVTLPVTVPATGPDVVLRPTNLPTPSPTQVPRGTYSEQWSQTTQADFAYGSQTNIAITAEGNGELVLAPFSTVGVYTSAVRTVSMPFVAVGSFWQANVPSGTELTIRLRASPDGQAWTSWQNVELMDAEREGARIEFGELVFISGSVVQYQLVLTSRSPPAAPRLDSLTLVLINSLDGPTADQALAISISPPGQPVVISRAAWGCDEKLMTWAPEYREVRKFVIHHTATSNGDLDPAATMRAILYYHAVTRGWGDIGYNYVIDAQGRIYEGRAGGEGVVGGHALQYNWGSIGVALLGNYEEIEVPQQARNSLVELVAWKGTLHFVDPGGRGFFIDRDLPNVMGHRDGTQSTTCPGRYAYAQLSAIAAQARTRMNELPPNVRLTAPKQGATVSNVVEIGAEGSPAVASVRFLANGVVLGTDDLAPFTWRWNTLGLSSAEHQLTAQAQTGLGLSAEHTITVTVNHSPPTGSLALAAFSNSSIVTLNTNSDSAQWMQFSNGWQWEGEDLSHQTGTLVQDPTALNGRAWLGRRGTDGAGWWYGPYLDDLPTGRNYQVYFRLRVGANESSARVATIDVTDNQAQTPQDTYASRNLAGADFGALTYVEFSLDFAYYRRNGGLEFRTFFTGHQDLYLDRVHLFSGLRNYARSASWTLSPGEGPRVAQVRYVDLAGNASPVYSATTVVDLTPPQWSAWQSRVITVRDTLSGLRANSLGYATSTDGGITWSGWQSLSLGSTDGITTPVTLSAPSDPASALKVRISDRAGNVSESVVLLQAGVTPSALPQPTTTLTSSPTATAVATSTPSITPSPSASASPTPSPSSTATATPSPTPTAAPWRVTGRVQLQGRSLHDDVVLSLGEAISTTTSATGAFSATGTTPGSYTITALRTGYLMASRELALAAGDDLALPGVVLLAGDVDGNCAINLFDLVMVASNYGAAPVQDSRADLNANGEVDIYDLVLVSVNFGVECPGPWPDPLPARVISRSGINPLP